MNSPLVSARPRVGSVRAFCRAFTLIELLAVITIILILAGLILNIAGNAQYRSSVARATTEVKQMETALENYKVDNGTYPRPSPAGTGSDLLNAQSNTDPTVAVYATANEFLFQQLSGYTGLPSGSTTLAKVYIAFLPGQLSTGSATPTTSTCIIDPFGFSYGYSTANQYAQDQYNSSGGATNTLSTSGYNPTFDLWSTAGYTAPPSGPFTGGKVYPAVSGSQTQPLYDATFWAKNW